MDFQSEKAVVLAHETAQIEAVSADALAKQMRADCLWRGYHPFNELAGAEAVSARFWGPLHQSFARLHRRRDIFFAGRNQIDDGGCWVVSMGHLVGLFDAPWLGIPPTGRMAFLRYCAFYRVADGMIEDVAMFVDIPHLMIQAGLRPFPVEQAGAQLVQPGPVGHDGLLYDAQPAEAGEKTLAAINAMIADLGQWSLGLPLEEELARTWHDDMIWWGPAGIGATYTIARYAAQHSGPFRAAFSERSKTGHVARLAEGAYGGFFGWPNFSAKLTGSYMGHEATGAVGEFRVIDIYRRQGDKLAENWVFIDIPHFWKSQGVDVLAASGAV